MSEMLRSAIVRLRRASDEQVVGMGFLVDAGKKTILTCAHVINAVIEDSTNQVKPRSLISLDFPFLDPEKQLDARVTRFFSKKRDNTDDVAVLEILDDLPAECEAVQLATAGAYSGHEFGVYGFPVGFENNGQYVEGTLQEILANHQLQAVGKSNLGHFVEEGFSGGPVYDKDLGVVVGMMMAIADDREKRVAYICPPKLIRQFLQASNTEAGPPATLQSIPLSTITKHSAIRARTDGALVFISYSHSDGEDLAKLIHKTLETNGCRVWVDYKDLAPGHHWDDEIDKAIEECGTMVAIVTPLALVSEEVRGEWARAKEVNKSIIPAVRKPVRIPRTFLLKQWIDLTDRVKARDELARLVASLGCTDGSSGSDIPDVPVESVLTNIPRPHIGLVVDFDQLHAYAMSLLKTQKYRELIDWVNSLEETSRSRDLYVFRAIAYGALGQIQESLDDYASAIEITPTDAQLYVQRAEINVGVGKIRDAFEDFEKALRLNPDLKDIIETETEPIVILVRHADQLPMPLFDEIEGRDDLVATATSHLESGQGILLYGMGGIGKTALSTVIAKRHLSEDRSVLWVNVGSARLETLLNAIGQEIERELDKEKQFNQAETTTQKSEYIAEWLRKEQPLLVLDDAWNPAETKQLLTAVLPVKSPVIVTTRRDDFEDMDGLIKFDLPKLSLDAAVKLYQTISDASDDEQAITALCQKLEYHPLAIRLAALKAKQGNRTATQMLSEIEAQPAQNSIRAIFDVVIDDVDNHATDAFHVIGALPVTRVTEHFVAIVLGDENVDVGVWLRDLADRGLINPTTTPDNEPFYAVHDLTYAYAHDLLVEQNRVDDLEHRVVQAACRYVESFSSNTPDDFRKLTVEKPTLIASISRARGYQDHDSIYALVDGLITFLDYQGYSIDHLNILEIALESADKQADKRKQARYWNESANISIKLGRYAEAIGFLEQALSVTREFGDRRSEGSIIGNLANVYVLLGEIRQATDYYENALQIVREIGDRGGEASLLNNLGSAWDTLGEKQKALDYFNQALLIGREVGDRRGEATTLSNVGAVWDDLGEKQKALEYYKQALTLSREIGDRRNEANSLTNLGAIWDDLGEKYKALEYYEQALVLHRAVSNLDAEAKTLGNIQRTKLQIIVSEISQPIQDVKDVPRRVELCQQALRVLSKVGNEQLWATLQIELGNSLSQHVLGSRADNMEQAIAAYQEALTVITRTNAPIEWATTVISLANAYRNRIRGDKADNMEQAIAAYQEALTVMTQSNAPIEWATTMNNLAASYAERIRGDRADNMEQAIAAYQQALTVRTQSAAPIEWARTLNNLANVYLNALDGDRAENIERAIDAYQQALTVTTMNTMPTDWAQIQNNLANAYRNRIHGNRAENIEQAIVAYQQALLVRTKDWSPLEWANTINNVANAYTDRIRGDRAENIEHAIALYEQALTVRTQTAMPLEWATTTMNLANTYANRIHGDRAENIEHAIALYEQALTVRTQTAMPLEWATTTMNLANAYANRITGERVENIKQAIVLFENAREITKALGLEEISKTISERILEVSAKFDTLTAGESESEKSANPREGFTTISESTSENISGDVNIQIDGNVSGDAVNIGGQQTFSGNITIGDEHYSEEDK